MVVFPSIYACDLITTLSPKATVDFITAYASTVTFSPSFAPGSIIAVGCIFDLFIFISFFSLFILYLSFIDKGKPYFGFDGNSAINCCDSFDPSTLTAQIYSLPAQK